MRRTRCAALCRQLGEHPHATAPPGGGAWLLIEHRGPWPATDLPADLAPALGDVVAGARARGIRPQLVRRPGARRYAPPVTAMVAWTRGSPEEVWMEERELDEPGELRELDLDAVAAGRRPFFGARRLEPLLLVCTHGRRDACCAQLGYPVAVALAAEFGSCVWETSHVGGDRFAPNVVCLPLGTYHGQVSAEDALRVGAACMRGEVSLPHYRGRTGLPVAVQAAEAFARRETGEKGVHAVAVLGHESRGDRATVDLRVGGETLRVEVAARRSGRPRTVSCTARTVGEPIEHVLLGVQPVVLGEP